MSPASSENSPENRGWRGRLGTFFYQRLGLDGLAALAAKKHVPVHRTTLFYFLGGMALFLFAVQMATGILLSLYYKPSPDQAFESVRAIMTEVDFGWLFRSIHSWSANLLIGILFLHLLTTYMMRAYRRPRELTWMTGVVLLGVFLAFGFSGYLLPWNQLAFFATRVGTAIAGSVPVVGKYALLIARSGEDVTGDTLARFYALHVVILPLTAMGLIGLHLFLVQKHGMSIPQGVIRKHGGEERVPSMPFVPHFLLRDMVGWYLALGILATLAALFPWDLMQKADPFGATPEGTKPEWYFLFMFQALKQLPPHLWGIEWLEGEMVGVVFFGLCGLLVLAVPSLDPESRPEQRRRVLNFLVAILAALLAAAVIWFLLQAAGAWVVFEWSSLQGEQISDATELATAVRQFQDSLDWWLQSVVFPVCSLLAIGYVASVTIRCAARQPRLNVNIMGALAVVFCIVMTAWGLVAK